MQKDVKIPKWKEQEEKRKKSSFDESLGKLGINKRFVTKQETEEKEKPVGA